MLQNLLKFFKKAKNTLDDLELIKQKLDLESDLKKIYKIGDVTDKQKHSGIQINIGTDPKNNKDLILQKNLTSNEDINISTNIKFKSKTEYSTKLFIDNSNSIVIDKSYETPFIIKKLKFDSIADIKYPNTDSRYIIKKYVYPDKVLNDLILNHSYEYIEEDNVIVNDNYLLDNIIANKTKEGFLISKVLNDYNNFIKDFKLIFNDEDILNLQNLKFSLIFNKNKQIYWHKITKQKEWFNIYDRSSLEHDKVLYRESLDFHEKLAKNIEQLINKTK